MPLRGKNAAAGLPSSPTLARSARGEEKKQVAETWETQKVASPIVVGRPGSPAKTLVSK